MMQKALSIVAMLMAAAYCVAASSASAQKRTGYLALPIGKKVLGFHLALPFAGKTLYARPAQNEHDVFYMEDMAAEMGVKPDFLMLEVDGIGNAFAMYDGELRMIVYDPIWFHGKVFSPRYATAIARHAVLAHELGHHVCGHTTGRTTKMIRWERELEADQFEGAVLAKLSRANSYIGGVALEEVLAAEAPFMSEHGSESHPPRALRLAAIRKGWLEGTSCGR
jgi:peptidase M48-like protein